MTLKTKDTQIGFIGTGEMATAMLIGLFRCEISRRENVFLYDINTAAIERCIARAGGGIACASLPELISNSQLIIFCVKPQHLNVVLEQIAKIARDDNKFAEKLAENVFLSIVAGARLATFQKYLGTGARLFRAMPNTPALIGEGASGYIFSESVRAEDKELIHAILESMGLAVAMNDESLLDAVTGLSGSGPAYTFLIIDALASGGVKMGLPRSVALKLAAQTLKGAAAMVLSSQEHPAVLQDRVTSPGGTTIAGLAALEAHQTRAAMIAAVEAATRRAIELGQ